MTSYSVHARLRIVLAAFAVAFIIVFVKMAHIGAKAKPNISAQMLATFPVQPDPRRGRLLDRNGQVLAMDLVGHSAQILPKILSNPKQTALAIERAIPDIKAVDTIARISKRLEGNRGSFFIKRKLSNDEVHRLQQIGDPGLKLVEEWQRHYPQGRLTSHVVGQVNVDGRGTMGMEKALDDRLHHATEHGENIRLSLDLRVQSILHDALSEAMEEFQARAANGVVMDISTGELLGMVSLPDFDPMLRLDGKDLRLMNRNSGGIYELGSIFKLISAATALETGVATMSSRIDVSEPCRVSRFRINDFRGKKRVMNFPEAVMFSSNVAMCKLALRYGTEVQETYFAKLGLLDPHPIELVSAGPARAPHWGLTSTATAAFGHGISVTPLHLMDAVATLVNGGYRRPATLLRRTDTAEQSLDRVIDAETSETVRWLMWLAVNRGAISKARVPMYMVGGKTGTAEKAGKSGYQRNRLLSSFLGAFPMHDPKYMVFVSLDEPKGTEETHGFATAGHVAAPTGRKVIEQMGPLMGIMPVQTEVQNAFRNCVGEYETFNGRTRQSEIGYESLCVPG